MALTTGVSSVRRYESARAAADSTSPASIAALVLVVLTAVFDNIMIAVGLFTYPPEHLSGIRIGLAPLEDFSYPVCAAFFVPAVFVLSSRGRRA